MVAVPLIVKGIETSCSLATDKVAVKVTSISDLPLISPLRTKVDCGGSSSSVMVIVFAVEIELVALVGEVLGVTIMVSPASSIESSIPVRVKVPVKEPAGISIVGPPLTNKILSLMTGSEPEVKAVSFPIAKYGLLLL